jgi:hypothetical protein
MMKLRLINWTLALVATAAVASLGVACGDDDDVGFGPGTGAAATTGGAGAAATGGVGATATGGTGAATNTGGGSADCGELVNAEGWIGGDAVDRTDDACGLQGAFYSYADQITCVPPEGNPCTEAGCCLPWATITDSTYASWGCGIGMELNSTGGDTPVKSPYTGTEVLGFQVTLSGDVPGFRIGFTQAADTTDTVSPFAVQGSGAGTYDVLFSETTCPSWGVEQGCVDAAVATSSHDLQVQVTGGEGEGSGTLCITSIVPITQ